MPATYWSPPRCRRFRRSCRYHHRLQGQMRRCMRYHPAQSRCRHHHRRHQRTSCPRHQRCLCGCGEWAYIAGAEDDLLPPSFVMVPWSSAELTTEPPETSEVAPLYALPPAVPLSLARRWTPAGSGGRAALPPMAVPLSDRPPPPAVSRAHMSVTQASIRIRTLLTGRGVVDVRAAGTSALRGVDDVAAAGSTGCARVGVTTGAVATAVASERETAEGGAGTASVVYNDRELTPMRQ